MKKHILFLFFFVGLLGYSNAQGTANDIDVSKLPQEVRQVLDSYINILTTSSSLDDCAGKFTAIAGGGLVNEDGQTLRSSIQPFSLKKDFDNVKFYASPIKITRVNATYSNGQGFGPSAIKGMVYKIWIAKKEGQAGMPAPISIMVPDGHESIRTPKVVGIGSL
ncbi:MAG: hypothetical protein EAZ55_02965 [Cytophagales bacterium]|nr:MAG: hypothetical protein EAZ55_02965 [Cytophagales bacterium]